MKFCRIIDGSYRHLQIMEANEMLFNVNSYKMASVRNFEVSSTYDKSDVVRIFILVRSFSKEDNNNNA
jgi:hypothetical protein